jgi:hypothetical protein
VTPTQSQRTRYCNSQSTSYREATLLVHSAVNDIGFRKRDSEGMRQFIAPTVDEVEIVVTSREENRRLLELTRECHQKIAERIRLV